MLEMLAVALPLSFAAGLNLYLTILVVGLSVHLGVVDRLPPGLQPFASWPVIVVAGVLYAIEFLADKIPYVDLVWNFIHTLIRPLGAVLIVSTLVVHVDPALSTIAMLLASATSLASHSTKTGARVLINTSPEPLSNIIASTLEDLGVVGLVVFTLRNPYWALLVTLALLAIIVLLLPSLLRWAWFWFQSVVALFKGLLGSKRTQPDVLPAEFVGLLNSRHPEWTTRCYCQGIKGANGKQGYLSLLADTLCFSYTKFPGRKRMWTLPLSAVRNVKLRRQPLLDVVEVEYQLDQRRRRRVRFIFMKDYALLSRQFADRLSGALPTQPASA